MKAIRERQQLRRAGLATLVVAVAFLSAGASQAVAAPAATVAPTSGCWLQVVNDWLDNNGTIKHLYPIPCYTQAIQKLQQYPDLQQYSSAIDDIQRALLVAIHEERDDGPGSGPSSNGPAGNSGGISGGGGGSSTGGGSGSGGGSASSSPIDHVFNPSSAQSVPLPLIILAALAVLLLLAGAGTWFAKRMQARRLTPATQPARVPPRRR
jgi:uncharacterized membrane protein YgcG